MVAASSGFAVDWVLLAASNMPSFSDGSQHGEHPEGAHAIRLLAGRFHPPQVWQRLLSCIEMTMNIFAAVSWMVQLQATFHTNYCFKRCNSRSPGRHAELDRLHCAGDHLELLHQSHSRCHECSGTQKSGRGKEEGQGLTDVEVKEGNLREDERIVQGHEHQRLDQYVQQVQC